MAKQGRVLVLQARGPDFESPDPRCGLCACNPMGGMGEETGGSLQLVGSRLAVGSVGQAEYGAGCILVWPLCVSVDVHVCITTYTHIHK